MCVCCVCVGGMVRGGGRIQQLLDPGGGAWCATEQRLEEYTLYTPVDGVGMGGMGPAAVAVPGKLGTALGVCRVSRLIVHMSAVTRDPHGMQLRWLTGRQWQARWQRGRGGGR